MHSGPTGVNTVSVEREQWDDSFEGELFEEIDLCSGIDEDGDVVQLGIVALVHL